MDELTPGVVLAIAVVSLIIWYYLIAGAVSSGMRKTNELIDKQNRILTRMLNHQGVDTQEINDLLHSDSENYLHKLMEQKSK